MVSASASSVDERMQNSILFNEHHEFSSAPGQMLSVDKQYTPLASRDASTEQCMSPPASIRPPA